MYDFEELRDLSDLIEKNKEQKTKKSKRSYDGFNYCSINGITYLKRTEKKETQSILGPYIK